MKKVYISLILLLTIGFVSCLEQTTTPTEVSSDATVKSMRFSAVDTLPGLAAATFLIEEGVDTGKIYNVDSILYGTRVDSVIPIFTFNATPSSAILYTHNDTISLSVSDTVDFSHNPTRLQVIASDNETEKWYHIYVNVHQVDPDLFVWERMANGVYPTTGAEHKVLRLGDQLCLFVNNGLTNSVYTSARGTIWTRSDVTGLPTMCQVRNMIVADETLYYVADKTVYTSTNASAWQATEHAAASFQFVNLLFEYNDSIWAIVEQGENYHLATSKQGAEWRVHEPLPANFPISDYAALTFESISGRPRAMVMGGFAANGESLNTRWNVELTHDRGYVWTNFSIEQPNFESLTGVDVVSYDNRLYLFGGVDANNQIGEYAILESIDEGLNWFVPDSAHNYLPDTYTLRTKPSVAVGSDNALYIVGGQSRTQIFSDVFRGKLNSIDW